LLFGEFALAKDKLKPTIAKVERQLLDLRYGVVVVRTRQAF
jgi:hypothetical protein